MTFGKAPVRRVLVATAAALALVAGSAVVSGPVTASASNWPKPTPSPTPTHHGHGPS